MPVRPAALLVVLGLTATAARAQTLCEGRADALGTARVLTVDAATTPRVGRKSFPQTLPLAPHEVVLTFDDGPWPGTTPHVLDALKNECVKATFFLVGGNAVTYPQLARREIAEGHTVGSHTYSHPLLDRMSFSAAVAEIDRGFAGVDSALYGQPIQVPRTPFFRFPGFASTPALLEHLEKRGIVVFGADLWASDWNPQSPDEELKLVLQRLGALRGGGIVLLHDTRAQTAAMLPEFLRALKRGGYSVVHVVPAQHPTAQSSPR
ncbi:MAG TPA: polysaccharide deacetylase family protein [Xanthobacteraceae bacterium]|nr:polysaccharide deacetylase family protein [Xanthobacteraceae bacterium]